MVENVRWKNIEDIETYIHAIDGRSTIRTDVEKLSERECMEEFMFLGLRMMCGVSGENFRNTFGKDIKDIYGSVLDKWTRLGMIVLENECYRLSDKGIDVSNVILADFILD
jgi:oxygen-independent coproporphyrinogen-3 oxidase